MTVKKKNRITSKRVKKPNERVEIAMDALAQLKNKIYKAQSGTYVHLPFELSGEASAKKTLGCFIDKQNTCKVCAKGALFLSTVRKQHESAFSVDDLNDASDDPTHLIDHVFEEEQLDLIESYFEGRDDFDSEYFEDESVIGSEKDEAKLKHLRRFVNKSTSSNTRLVKILENMIENDGQFIPEKLKV